MKYYFLKFSFFFFNVIINLHCGDVRELDASGKQEGLVNKVSLDSLLLNVEVLTGNIPFAVNNDSVFIKSRHADYEGNESAVEFITSRMNNYGYSVNSRNPYGDCLNLISQKTGIKYPDTYILIGAHYDSMPDRFISPGADDNASGTAAVLEAARIFSEVETSYSVIFALWDEEESPSPMGSEFYAQYANEERLNIIEVINIDMIAWDSDNNGELMVYRNSFDSDSNIEEKLFSIIERYSLNLNIIFRNTPTRSDDRAFAREGFNTICFIEKYLNSSHHPDNDFNPYWHSREDTIDKFNKQYYFRNVQLIIALLADLTL